MKKERKDDIQKELREISPFLADLKKTEGGFKVPKDYFEQLPEQIMERVQPGRTVTTEPAAQPSWWDRTLNSLALLLQPRYATALAAIALLLVAVWIWQKPSPSTPELASNNNDSLMEFIEDNIDEYEADYLISVIETGDDNEEETTVTPLLDVIIDDLDDTELEELL